LLVVVLVVVVEPWVPSPLQFDDDDARGRGAAGRWAMLIAHDLTFAGDPWHDRAVVSDDRGPQPDRRCDDA